MNDSAKRLRAMSDALENIRKEQKEQKLRTMADAERSETKMIVDLLLAASDLIKRAEALAYGPEKKMEKARDAEENERPLLVLEVNYSEF
ncbi:MAG: hypothetical protein IJM50_03430 [Lachnospiraceae bacterium]|nr:hypothetical protein [Lachnospiraceae bacterium]